MIVIALLESIWGAVGPWLDVNFRHIEMPGRIKLQQSIDIFEVSQVQISNSSQ